MVLVRQNWSGPCLDIGHSFMLQVIQLSSS
uniref:Uncharacterized protein n=1 Tax=Arundo donax TaxID=35708 RepID=A0A0A9AAP0_ARUDO